MSQGAYNINMTEAFEGLLVDSRENTIESHPANGAIPFGYGVVSDPGDANEAVTVPGSDVATIVWDADFVTGNSITVTVNGESTGAVAFDTDHATTVEAVRAAIAGLSTVKEATRTDTGGDDRTIRIETVDDVEIAVTESVTGGASQASGTITESTDNIFMGVAVHTHKEPTNSGSARWEDTESVSVLRQGQIHVPVSVAVANLDLAYLIVTGANAGKFTNVSSGNLATGGRFRSTTSGAGIAKIDVNLP